ncbi:MAG: phosphodiester glycosidase family protein [Rhodanobacteraceae bacterium]
MSRPSFLRVAIFAAAFALGDAHALESRKVVADGAEYRVVTLDLSHETLELHWLDANGQAYANIETLKRAGESGGRVLAFATNAGIYDRENRPLGLTIADGTTLRPLNTTRGRSGNFGIQPNGVFYVDRGGHAGVVTTAAWRERGIEARIATQSGPMLVVDGEINANFVEESESRKWRSGVCVPADGRVAFAVSESPVTFHAFARVFRDALGCRDALYLDGTLSRIWTRADGYSGAPAVMVRQYAAMLAVFEAAPAENQGR